MKVGLYKSNICKNQLLRRVRDNKLEVVLEEHCAWCCEAHEFELFEVTESGRSAK